MMAAIAAPAHADSEITIERVVTCQRMVGSVCESTLVCWVQSNGYWWCENGQSGGRRVPGAVILDWRETGITGANEWFSAAGIVRRPVE
jgi:hypothetical protein